MALPLITLILALISADSLHAQSPAPLRLSFCRGRSSGDGAEPGRHARSRDRRLPCRRRGGARAPGPFRLVAQSLDLGLMGERNFNSKAQGISFPGVPTIIGPFNAYDGRVRLTQTLFDFSNLGRVSAAKSQASAAGAERSAVVESSAQNVALAYARAIRAQAVVTARGADSVLARELVGLAVAQQQAGVSASIDVTRAKTQLAAAAGALIVAENQLDRARIDLARALGLDPATPITLTDTLNAQLGAADVPADRNGAVAQAVTARPDLAAELARGAAARTSASAISAERLPRLELEADYGLSGVRMPDAMAHGKSPYRSRCPFWMDSGAKAASRSSRQWCGSRTFAPLICASRSPPMWMGPCSTCGRQVRSR